MTKGEVVLLAVTVLTLVCVASLLWISRKSDASLDRIEDRLDTSVDVKTGEELRATLVEQQEMTRQHISNTVGTISHESSVSKGLLYELHQRLTALIALMEKFITGLGK